MDCEIAILGAGCSGMTLALQLALLNYSKKVVVIDRRTDFSREQRWCSWGPLQLPLSSIESRTWRRFTITGGGQTRLFDYPARPYLHIYAPHYFEKIYSELAKVPTITVALNEAVVDIERDRRCGKWNVATSSNTYSARIIIDARNLESSLDRVASDTPWLWQSFAGRIVETDREVFDEATTTLMDFDVPGGEIGAFVYVLPFTARTALVESTLISLRAATKFDHLSTVDKYVSRLDAGDISHGPAEYGNIPMTTLRMPLERDINYFAIGISGGATKPSTGYAFARIQKQCRDVARDIVEHGAPAIYNDNLAMRRRNWLDDVFITASADDNRFFTKTILKMADKLSPELLIRFLSERSSILDDLTVMGVVGSPQLVRAAAKLQSRQLKA